MQHHENWNALWTEGVDVVSVVGPQGATISEETSVALVRAAPGSAPVPMHFHIASTEIYLIVAGHADVTVDGDTFGVAPGATVVIEKREAHSIVPVGPDELIYWAVSTPPWRIEDHIPAEPTVGGN